MLTASILVFNLTIINLYTRFTVRNAWTDITDAQDIVTLKKNFTNKEKINLRLIRFTIVGNDNWEKNSIFTSIFTFGQGSMGINSRLSGIQALFNEPYGTGYRCTIVFKLSGSTPQYFRN